MLKTLNTALLLAAIFLVSFVAFRAMPMPADEIAEVSQRAVANPALFKEWEAFLTENPTPTFGESLRLVGKIERLTADSATGVIPANSASANAVAAANERTQRWQTESFWRLSWDERISWAFEGRGALRIAIWLFVVLAMSFYGLRVFHR